MSATAIAHFQQIDQLNRDSCADLAIRHGIVDTAREWNDCLDRDMRTDLIDTLHQCMWLVAKQEGTHVDPLHEHLRKGRTIVITETPRLHLVWYYKTVYIKPLPSYLLNHAIWVEHIPTPTTPIQSLYDRHRAALGFLRSYSFLIKHESDFIIAQRADLLPKYISFQRFQKFIRPYRSLHDKDVSHRYQFGQLRLTRLNKLVHVARIYSLIAPKWPIQPIPWFYQEQAWQTGQYFQEYIGPLIFVFAILTLILSSMQVILAGRGPEAWKPFVQVSWGFSIAIIIFAGMLIAGVPLVVLMVLLNQARFALNKWKELRSTQNVANRRV